MIWKQTFNGFAQPARLRRLREPEVHFVLVAGLVTSVCVLATALGAADPG